MASTSLNLSFGVATASPEAGYIAVEQDSERYAPSGAAYCRVYHVNPEVQTFTSSGKLESLGTQTENTSQLLTFSGSDTASIRPGAKNVTIEALGKFYDPSGESVEVVYKHDPLDAKVRASRKGYGVCRVTFDETYDLHYATFDWNTVTNAYEVMYVAAMDTATMKIASTTLTPRDPSGAFNYGSLKLEQDGERPPLLVSAQSGVTTTEKINANGGFQVFTTFGVNLQTIFGSASVSGGIKDREIVDTLTFSNSSSASLRYPSVNGAFVRDLKMVSGYTSFAMPGQVIYTNLGGETRVVGPQEVVAIDGFGVPTSVLGALVVEYTTVYQEGLYVYQYDRSELKFKPGLIIATDGLAYGSLNMSPPNMKGNRYV